MLFALRVSINTRIYAYAGVKLSFFVYFAHFFKNHHHIRRKDINTSATLLASQKRWKLFQNIGIKNKGKQITGEV